jgi:hypothetical protein
MLVKTCVKFRLDAWKFKFKPTGERYGGGTEKDRESDISGTWQLFSCIDRLSRNGHQNPQSTTLSPPRKLHFPHSIYNGLKLYWSQSTTLVSVHHSGLSTLFWSQSSTGLSTLYWCQSNTGLSTTHLFSVHNDSLRKLNLTQSTILTNLSPPHWSQ